MDLVPHDVVSFAEEAAGNPFYLGELTAHAARGGDMHAGPKSIRELIEVQCVALTKEAQRVLLVIALFEGRATIPRISANLGYQSDQFIAVLEELEQAGLIAVVEGHLRCKHEFVAETAANVAMESVRSFVRVRIAEQLETEADETGSIELLGDAVAHWERAVVSQRAYLASMKLGNRLLQIGLGTEAESAFERAARSAQSPSDEIAALESSIAACHLSANWRKAQTIDSRRIAISKSSLGGLHTLPQNDLLVAEAAVYAVFFSPNRRDLHSVASDRNRPKSLRMRAASILAIWGDNAFEREAIEDAIRAVRDLDVPNDADTHALLLQIVYHIVIGDRDIARERAEDLRRAAEGSADYSVRIHGLRRAGQAFMRVGATTEASHATTCSLQLSTHLRLPLHEISCFETLFNLAISMDDFTSAELYAREIRRLANPEMEVARAQANISEATSVWIKNDPKRAKELLDEADAFATPGMYKSEQAVLASKIAMQLVAHGVVRSEQEVRRLVQLHELGAGFGHQDLATSVVVGALRSIGDLGAAQETLNSYIAERRRDVLPYPTLLRNAADRVQPTTN
ncbi:MAG: hypothetical protein JST16_16490 [Bdellovibrionales bacterium]|nr:hypothetical protein [Bdellovibrionales bacterium]